TVKEVSPKEAAPGATVQIIGRNFGPSMGMKDPLMPFGVSEVQFNGVAAEVVQWRDTRIEVKLPSNATTGPLVVRVASMDPLPDGSCCAPVEYSSTAPVAFTVMTAITQEPTEGPMGSPVVISGRGFGQRKPGEDAVLFNGIPAPILQWTNTQIRVMFPLKGSSGPVTLKRGSESRVVGAFRSVEAGLFTLVAPKVASLSPETAEIGSLITITGSGFGEFIKSDERTQDNLSREGHQHQFTQFGVNITRSGVLFPANKEFVKASHVAGYVESWTDTEIKVRVPQVAVPGKVLITRGSWDLLPDGTCCKDKEWI